MTKQATKGEFGVMTFHDGEWKLIATFARKSDAEREAVYCRDVLGINAKVFIKL